MIKVITIKSPTPPVGQEDLRWIDTSTVPYKEYDWTVNGWMPVNDYETAVNKPKIEGVTLTEETSLEDIGAQAKLEQSFLEDPLGIMPFKWVYNSLTESLDLIDFSQFVPESTTTYKGIGYNQTYDWKQDLELPELADSSKLVFESSDESVATVDSNGVITMVSDYSSKGLEECEIRVFLDYGALVPKFQKLTVYNRLVQEGGIAFTIDVATEGNFTMEFEGGRAWLDATELTTDVPMPNVVGKHVIVIEESVVDLNLPEVRLQGDLTITGLTSFGTFACYNNQITSLSLPMLTDVQDIYCRNNQLTSLNLSALTRVGEGGLECGNNQLPPQAIEYILHTLLNVSSNSKTLNISGGTNAAYDTWSQQAKDDFATLQNSGWSIQYNE